MPNLMKYVITIVIYSSEKFRIGRFYLSDFLQYRSQEPITFSRIQAFAVIVITTPNDVTTTTTPITTTTATSKPNFYSIVEGSDAFK